MKTLDFDHSERVIDREQGITQGALAAYYVAVAAAMLPHVADRPLALVRQSVPTGQRSLRNRGDDLASDAVDTVAVNERDGVVPHAIIHDERGLVALVEAFALEIRTSAARASNVEHPDRLVFELDPGERLAFGEVAKAAQILRALFQGLELESFAMTRGRRGLDIVVPIAPEQDWEAVRSFEATVADTLVATAPTRYSTSGVESELGNRVRVGYVADPGATFIAPYSIQLLPNAPVAMPTFWYELEQLEPERYTPTRVIERLETIPSDPWERLSTLEQRLTEEHRASLAAALKSALGS